MTWKAPEPYALESYDQYLGRTVGSMEDYVNAHRRAIMEHRLAEPTTESVGSSKKRTVFDAIENPEKGWITVMISHASLPEEEPSWLIELRHEATGASVTKVADSLYVAWARATEQAHMMNIGLN